MSHVLFWPGRTLFYLLGNTSAICLTENMPPEHDADVLLLGCGDPRHILFTVYTDTTRPATGKQLSVRALCPTVPDGHPSGLRKLDVTCCDMEAAILGT